MKGLKVLFAGTPGVRKRRALANLHREVARLSGIPAVTIDDRVPIVDHLIYQDHPVPFLKQPFKAQREIWREKFAVAHGRFHENVSLHQFLGVHLTYHFERYPSCAVSFPDIVNWGPDCIVTFIDDAYCMRERISGEYPSFTLAELILWRAEELLLGDLLARFISPERPIPNFLVAVKHPAKMLARLLLGLGSLPRVYVSHLITDVRDDPAKRLPVDTFIRRLRNEDSCVAFEPLTIDELPILKAIAGNRKKDIRHDPRDDRCRWPILDPDEILGSEDDIAPSYPLRIPRGEILDVSAALEKQVNRRDLRLVDQSQALVLYRPTMNQSPQLSTGVQAEVNHANATGRRVIWYVKKGEDPEPRSPFASHKPGDNPDYICARTDDLFWERLSTLKESYRSEFDSFLR